MVLEQVAQMPQDYYKEQVGQRLMTVGEDNITEYTGKFVHSLLNYPPPVPFVLVFDDEREVNPDQAGWTYYKPLHIRFKWQNNYAEASWQIDGDIENLIKPSRYWDLA